MQRGIPAGNPIANALVVIVGALVIGASIVLGFVAFVILGSILLVLGAVIGLRVWWFNRKLRRGMQTSATRGERQERGVIEGEYRVVKRDEKP
jgi:protein-S-isoprenylcysteine O-methyltransferase Ste14